MSQEIAREILAQLGGNKFIAMTGAKNLVAGQNSLSFKLPANFAKNKINHVQITLNSMDTYDVTYRKLWGTKLTDISESKGLYNDMLQSDFTEITGLDCTMGRLIRA